MSKAIKEVNILILIKGGIVGLSDPGGPPAAAQGQSNLSSKLK